MIVGEINSRARVERAIFQLRSILEGSEQYGHEKQSYYIRTYGCQMNEHDSETMSYILEESGYIRASSIEEANLIVMNTCAIRENAENRFYGNLGVLKHLKSKKKDFTIAVCGCMMQMEHIVNTIKKSYPIVDIVFGTHNIYELPNLLLKHLEKGGRHLSVLGDSPQIFAGFGARRNIPHKAFVNITYGCNNYCTYCVVPYTRGREKSRLPQSILSEVRTLIADGVKEIYLLGQNVNSYGKRFVSPSEDLDQGYNFSRLLRDINDIPGKFRIRFMTSHPKDLSDDLISAMSECDKVEKYFHLPVQAGSDKVLKRMNRGYTVEHYLNLVRKLRKAVPNISISTDIIIGFPGEVEEDVDMLIDLIKEVRYDSAFTFIYSAREGTPAAKFKDQVPEALKHKRFERMLSEMNSIVIEKNRARLGDEMVILADSWNDGVLTGKSACMRTVSFEGPKSLVGTFVDVKITKAKKFSLLGEIINV